MSRRVPRQGRALATVEAVLEAAALLLVADGYERLTTNKVAERAGVSVGTLYQYFPNKNAVVEAVVERIAAARLAAFADALQGLGETTLEQAINVILDGTLAAMRVQPELARVLMRDAPRGGRLDLERAWVLRSVELVQASMYESNREELRTGDLELMAYVIVTGSVAVLNDAAAYRPELVRGDMLRNELAVLCRRYLEP